MANKRKTQDDNSNIKHKTRKLCISEELIDIETYQWKELLKLNYDKNVEYIYNPLEYAKETHENFIRKFCETKKNVLLLGMNPGPWGMCQTGVPFGEVNYVKNWLKIEGNIKKPEKEHKQKLVEGFNCHRTEVSGERMWKLLKNLSGDPSNLFQHTFLHNYCPLAFLSKSGKNITPAEFKVVQLLDVKYLVCIGNYVAKRAEKALAKSNLLEVKISTMMHPSPINPKANKGWSEIVMKQLEEASVLPFIKCSDKLISETNQ